jgi:gamma-glutamylcyclotransferase (GGCT)/AIG2-like uncharacterized protein YtfP
MNNKNLYFAYGANMHPEAMQWRCPKALASQAFILRDWELRFYSHATIEPCKGATVAGVLWEITEDCEQNLDMFEGFPNYYTKRTWIQDGCQFFFYEMTAPKSGRPSEGYVLDIVESYKFWQLPQKLLTKSLHDPA